MKAKIMTILMQSECSTKVKVHVKTERLQVCHLRPVLNENQVSD